MKHITKHTFDASLGFLFENNHYDETDQVVDNADSAGAATGRTRFEVLKTYNPAKT